MKKILILLMLMTLSACTVKKEVIFITKDQPIEVKYGDIPDFINDVVLETNGDVSYNNTYDRFIVGDKSIIYTIDNGDNKITQEVKFTTLPLPNPYEVLKDTLPQGRYYQCDFNEEDEFYYRLYEGKLYILGYNYTTNKDGDYTVPHQATLQENGFQLKKINNTNYSYRVLSQADTGNLVTIILDDAIYESEPSESKEYNEEEFINQVKIDGEKNITYCKFYSVIE